uniref:NADH dehydrogenase subunit 4L n=1 Tax=Euphaedusa spinula TaxID=1885682 RepID=A0A224A136_9EUPU|nr:NADH dehydrogenase subunit 4L [Euphaedusa spinula]BBA10490.1 NADH dehydrogenase subunit 4L [Euphaedusa spinula]
MYYLNILTLLLVLMFYLYLNTMTHFLSALLYLEVMMFLSLMMVIIICLLVTGSIDSFLLILTLAVCEAALGLAILLSFLKVNGNDYIHTKMSLIS